MKAIFSDLDETLLVDFHVPEENRKSIACAREAGCKFVPCSGRPPFFMSEILKELDLYQKAEEYYICFNGGMILEAKEDRVLFYQGLSYEEALIPVRLAKKYDLCAMVVTKDCFHMFHANEAEVERKVKQKAPFVTHEGYDLSALKEEPIGKVMLVKIGDIPYLKAVLESMEKEERELFEVSFSSNRFMEFNKKGISKGNALRFLADYLKLERGDTIAIGDSYNDLSMLEAAGIGACVSSASADIKEKCDYVCQRDYMEGAVSEVIEHLMRGELV